MVVLLLGSNIEPEINLPLAASRLAEHFRVIRASNVWETAAVGTPGPNFLNAALLIQTNLDHDQIKQRFLRPLETQLGRVRSMDKFAPRTIDIDVIVWGEDVCDPEIWDHAHQAVPTAELLPDLQSKHTCETLNDVAERLLRKGEIKKRSDITHLLHQHVSDSLSADHLLMRKPNRFSAEPGKSKSKSSSQ